MEDAKLCELVGQNPCLYDPEHKNYKELIIRQNSWIEISAELRQSVEECKNRWRNIRDTYKRRKRIHNKTSGSFRFQRLRKWHLERFLFFLKDMENDKTVHSDSDSNEQQVDETEPTTMYDDESSFDNIEAENIHIKEEECSEEETKLISQQPASNKQKPVKKLRGNKKSIQIFEKNRQQKQKYNLKRQKLCNKNSLEIRENYGKERQKTPVKTIEILTEEHPIDVFFKSMAASVKKMSRPMQIRAKMQVCELLGRLELEDINGTSPSHSHIEFSSLVPTSSGSCNSSPPDDAI